jgi:hypothetical protein
LEWSLADEVPLAALSCDALLYMAATSCCWQLGRSIVRMFHVFAALAEFIRGLIAESTVEGLTAARDCGRRCGLAGSAGYYLSLNRR